MNLPGNIVNGRDAGQRRRFEAEIAGLLRRLGAVRVVIKPEGIASHWKTDFEATVALEKFREMGLTQAEKFPDAGLVAVFVKFFA